MKKLPQLTDAEYVLLEWMIRREGSRIKFLLLDDEMYKRDMLEKRLERVKSIAEKLGMDFNHE